MTVHYLLWISVLSWGHMAPTPMGMYATQQQCQSAKQKLVQAFVKDADRDDYSNRVKVLYDQHLVCVEGVK